MEKEKYLLKSEVEQKFSEKLEEINNGNLNYSEDEYWLESEIKGYAMEHIRELLDKILK